MFRKAVVLCIAFVFVISLAGCATGRKQKELEIQGLKNQISLLESQIQSKEEELNGLRAELAKASEEKPEGRVISYGKTAKKKTTVYEVKSRPKVKQIQIALRNAGLNPGAIDGKMGKATRDAIKDFQKAHNLSADGKVGKETWELLGPYLYQKLK